MFIRRLKEAPCLYMGYASAMHSASALIASAFRGKHDNLAREERPDREEKKKVSILGGDFLNVNLGDNPIKFLCLDINKINEQVLLIYNDIKNHPDSSLLTKLHFLTVNPSPEFMYLQYKNFMAPNDFKSQLFYFERLFDFISSQHSTKILSISAEEGKGKGRKPYLHYHLILVASSKRSYKKFYNSLRDQVTTLHLTKGRQSALRESEVQFRNLYEGISYFNGIQPGTNDRRLKQDYHSTYPYCGL